MDQDHTQKILEKAKMSTPKMSTPSPKLYGGGVNRELNLNESAVPTTKTMLSKTKDKQYKKKISDTVTDPGKQNHHATFNAASGQPRPGTQLDKMEITKITKSNFGSAEMIYNSMRTRISTSFSTFEMNPILVIEWDAEDKAMFTHANILHFIVDHIDMLINIKLTIPEVRAKFEGFDLKELLSDTGDADTGKYVTTTQMTNIVTQVQSMLRTLLNMDDINTAEIVEYLLDLPGFRLEGLQILHQAFSAAQDIMRKIFDIEDANTTVKLVHQMHNSWSLKDNDPISVLGINGAYLGAVPHLIMHSVLASVMSATEIRERWKQITEICDFNKCGGLLSTFITNVHELLHEFARLVERSDRMATKNGHHPSNLFLSDATGVNALMMILGTDFVYGTNAIAWTSRWKDVWKECSAQGNYGPDKHYAQRLYFLVSGTITYEQEYPATLPHISEILVLPDDFTSKVLTYSGTNGTGASPHGSQPQASQMSPSPGEQRRGCPWCGDTAQGRTCGRNAETCVRRFHDCLNNGLEFFCKGAADELLSKNPAMKINPPRQSGFNKEWVKKQNPNMSKPAHPKSFRPHNIPEANLGDWVGKPSTQARRNRICGVQPSTPTAQVVQQGNVTPAPTPPPPVPAPPPPVPASTVVPPPPPAIAHTPNAPPAQQTGANVVQGNAASVSIAALNTRVDGLESSMKDMLKALMTMQQQADQRAQQADERHKEIINLIE